MQERSGFFPNVERISSKTVSAHKMARNMERTRISIWMFSIMRMFENLAHQGIKPLMIFYMMTIGEVTTVREAAAVVAVSSAASDILAVAGGYISQKILGLLPAMVLGFSSSIVACFLSVFVESDRIYDCLACITCSYAINKSAGSALLSIAMTRYSKQAEKVDGKPANETIDLISRVVYMVTECGGVLAHITIGVFAEVYGLRLLLMLSGIAQIIAMSILVLITHNGIISPDIDSRSLLKKISPIAGIGLIAVCGTGFIASVLLIGFLFREFSGNLLQAICLVATSTLGAAMIHSVISVKIDSDNDSRIPWSFWAYSFFYTGLMFCIRQLNYVTIPLLHVMVNREFYGITIPTSAIVSIFPATTIVATLFTNKNLDKMCVSLSYMRKITFGYAFLSLSWIFIAVGSWLNNPNTSEIHMIWAILHIMFMGIADSYIVPCMLSLESMVVPEKMRGLVAGIAFAPAAISLYLSDRFAEKFFYYARGNFSPEVCFPGLFIISCGLVVILLFLVLCLLHSKRNKRYSSTYKF